MRPSEERSDSYCHILTSFSNAHRRGLLVKTTISLATVLLPGKGEDGYARVYCEIIRRGGIVGVVIHQMNKATEAPLIDGGEMGGGSGRGSERQEERSYHCRRARGVKWQRRV